MLNEQKLYTLKLICFIGRGNPSACCRTTVQTYLTSAHRRLLSKTLADSSDYSAHAIISCYNSVSVVLKCQYIASPVKVFSRCPVVSIWQSSPRLHLLSISSSQLVLAKIPTVSPPPSFASLSARRLLFSITISFRCCNIFICLYSTPCSQYPNEPPIVANSGYTQRAPRWKNGRISMPSCTMRVATPKPAQKRILWTIVKDVKVQYMARGQRSVESRVVCVVGGARRRCW